MTEITMSGFAAETPDVTTVPGLEDLPSMDDVANMASANDLLSAEDAALLSNLEQRFPTEFTPATDEPKEVEPEIDLKAKEPVVVPDPPAAPATDLAALAKAMTPPAAAAQDAAPTQPVLLVCPTCGDTGICPPEGADKAICFGQDDVDAHEATKMIRAEQQDPDVLLAAAITQNGNAEVSEDEIEVDPAAWEAATERGEVMAAQRHEAAQAASQEQEAAVEESPNEAATNEGIPEWRFAGRTEDGQRGYIMDRGGKKYVADIDKIINYTHEEEHRVDPATGRLKCEVMDEQKVLEEAAAVIDADRKKVITKEEAQQAFRDGQERVGNITKDTAETIVSGENLTIDAEATAQLEADIENTPVDSDAPAPVLSVPAQFITDNLPEIIGMDMEKRAIDIAMKANIPLILIGHTGLAKTTAIGREHQDRRWPHRHITFNGAVEVDTILGKWVATPKEGMVFKLGILPFCMKHGISLTFNEINFAPAEVNVLIHELVDEGHITLLELDPEHPDFIIKPHPNFRLFGTMNPPELYAGARELSPALARRCIVRRVADLSREEEARVIIELVEGVSADVAKGLAEAGHSIRESFHANKTIFYLSTADLIMTARLMGHGVTWTEAVEFAIIGKAHETDRDFLSNTFRLVFDPEAQAANAGF